MTQEIVKQYAWSENLLKTFTQRKSRSFWWSGKQTVLIGTWMWQQNLSWHHRASWIYHCAIFARTNDYLFLASCFRHMLSFKYLYYMVILSETKTEERYYISLALTVVNCRLSFQNWKKLSQRKLRPRKKKWLAELGLKSNLETSIFWYRESHCQSRMKIGLVIFCFLKNFVCIWNQYRVTVENSGNTEVSKKNKVKSRFLPYLTIYHQAKFPSSLFLYKCVHIHTYIQS